MAINGDLSSGSDEGGFSWGHSGLTVDFQVLDSRITLANLAPGATLSLTARLQQPNNLVEIKTVAGGSDFSANRNNQTHLGSRLMYMGHVVARHENLHLLTITQRDPDSDLHVETLLQSVDGSGTVSCSTRLINHGMKEINVLAVSSFVLEFPIQSSASVAEIDLWWARNEWLSEARWEYSTLRQLLPDVNRTYHPIDSRSAFGVSGIGAWSSGRYLPMGMLENHESGQAFAWQVENPGPWRWEVAEREQSIYLGLFGPLDNEHQWSEILRPGESFLSASATLSTVMGGWNDAIAELTRARRNRRMPHASFVSKPVVFNDYMNALMGDPTEAKLLPLVEAAAQAGAEIFCIDAGWFDEGPTYWWDEVGEYEVSPTRFPRGLNFVLDRIRQLGMTPGLWLEPEVIGVLSPLASSLPDGAFFQRGGERLREHTRFHLDVRHPAARAHLDALVDRLVAEHGVGYLKLDYNINPGPGTDGLGGSVGRGLMGHGRAYLEWLRDVRSRHPELIIMNCASGGMRMDGATQQVTQLQQMTDQQDFLSYVPIAAASPTAVPFDQAAAWTYPDHTMTRQEIEFCMVAPMLSRMELSGQLDKLSEEQLSAVLEAVDIYKEVRGSVLNADPVWPSGLPKWTDEWFSLGLKGDDQTLLNVWRRSGQTSQISLTLDWLRGHSVKADVLYPHDVDGSIDWDDHEGVLTVNLNGSPTAVFIRLR